MILARKRQRRPSKPPGNRARRKVPDAAGSPSAAGAPVGEAAVDGTDGAAMPTGPALPTTHTQQGAVHASTGHARPVPLTTPTVPAVTPEPAQPQQLYGDDDGAAVASDTSSNGDSNDSAMDGFGGSRGFGSGSDADSATAAFAPATRPDTGAGDSGAEDLTGEVAAASDGPGLSRGGTQMSGFAPPGVAAGTASLLHQRSPDQRRAHHPSTAQPWRCVFVASRPGSRYETRAPGNNNATSDAGPSNL